ncbi:hypothetical protein M407DRAFT_240459 [Tulasnella calospora MUT 4182]|uniref:Uncharacterized protein n=1 Tax=Tulasnella calospora MUT 4182 TaxID=1051891 RepID=A0A0C3QZ04_9AGAM|nr:hypothetical protein M407DRAFT_240459 [Tulasnella calospora MUT 4182]
MVSQSTVRNQKNIWVAAGDGDLGRVQELLDEGMSPNAADENTYTPMHAAASYAQIPVLEFLLSRGGNVNITDEDGETPLFVVETVEVARYLLEHGADMNHRNNDGELPVDRLEEDAPEVSDYLRSRSSAVIPDTSSGGTQPLSPSQFATDQAAEHLSSELISQVQEIMERAEREGVDPEEELRKVVGDSLLASIRAGQGMSGQNDSSAENGDTSKRARLDGSPER